LRILESEDVGVRLFAVEELSKIANDEALAGLTKAFQDPNRQIRTTALQKIQSTRGNTAAVPGLISCP
jgi:HEAT repeat protein